MTEYGQGVQSTAVIEPKIFFYYPTCLLLCSYNMYTVLLHYLYYTFTYVYTHWSFIT